MLKAYYRAGALLACFAAQLAGAQTPPAAPQARWHLDGATSRCVLTRRLEGTPGAITFILRTIPGSGRYDVIVASPELPPALRRATAEARIRLGAGGTTYQALTAAIEVPAILGQGATIGPLPASVAAEFANASSLDLADAQGRPLGRWSIPTAARAGEALAYCEREKQVDWGADPAALEPGATPPRPVGDAGSWVTPRELRVSEAWGPAAVAAVFRLVVGPDGRVTGCALLESASNVELDQSLCGILTRRARYQPARGAGGAPVSSVAVHIVAFRREVEFRTIPG